MKNKVIHHSSTFRLSLGDSIPLMVWVGVFFITWMFMNGADHFLKLTPEALGKYWNYKWFLIAHITAGGGSLILGLIQFWSKLRNYSNRIHRVIGILYLLAVLVSSLCALLLAFTTSYDIGVAYAFSLQVWVSVWISATVLAYYSALRKNYRLHEQWMIRSYIVTLAFVVSGLILKIPYVKELGSFAEISPSLFWFGWAVPLYMYELIRSSKQL